MSKKVINQNTNDNMELLNSVESNFIFDEKPIIRFKNTALNLKIDNINGQINKKKELEK